MLSKAGKAKGYRVGETTPVSPILEATTLSIAGTGASVGETTPILEATTLSIAGTAGCYSGRDNTNIGSDHVEQSRDWC